MVFGVILPLFRSVFFFCNLHHTAPTDYAMFFYYSPSSDGCVIFPVTALAASTAGLAK